MREVYYRFTRIGRSSRNATIMSIDELRAAIVDASIAVDALKFGSFTLKSGRLSPYFFNAGLLSSGKILLLLSRAYASLASSPLIPDFDVVFGPAYKGISLAAAAAIELARSHDRDVGFAYDRKEAKDHGEGGTVVGASVSGKRVLLLDDVMTSGKALTGAMKTVQEAGGTVVGVLLLLDREEVGPGGKSTVQEMQGLLGRSCPVLSILRLRDLVAGVETRGMKDELARMQAYREQYGIKDT